MEFCPRCGSEYAGNPNFCGRCGAKLSGTGVESPQKMTGSLPILDWSKSDAHLLLLSNFLRGPSKPDYFFEKDYWQAALGESPRQAIQRFLGEGMLVQADLAVQLTYKFKVIELKAMLKKRSLHVSGHKDDLARRLVEADPDGMKGALAGLPMLLVCSTRGCQIAGEYLAKEKVMCREAEQQTAAYLQRGMFKEASMAVAAYEARQVFPRGFFAGGAEVHSEHYDYTRDVDALEVIFGRTPKILGKVDEGQLGPLRLAAGMAHLWGTNQFEEWLPLGFKSGPKMDNDAAARMLMLLGIHEATIAGYRRSGVVGEVEILVARDERLCDACASIADKRFKLDEVPELPYEHCTSETGCRCCFAPVVSRG